MSSGGFFNNGFTQLAVIKNAVDIVVIELFGAVDINFCIDMQGLGGTQFVGKNANAGIKGQF